MLGRIIITTCFVLMLVFYGIIHQQLPEYVGHWQADKQFYAPPLLSLAMNWPLLVSVMLVSLVSVLMPVFRSVSEVGRYKLYLVGATALLLHAMLLSTGLILVLVKCYKLL